MYIIIILVIIVCVLLGLIVLVQNSKGGGLAANFAAPTQVMGVRQTADFLEKATWWLAGILVALCLIGTIVMHNGKSDSKKEMKVTGQTQSATPQQPAAPAQSAENGTAQY